jgi:presenilin-like A22 family membrane protease
MPELEDNSTTQKIWRRVFYSIVLTSVEFFLAAVAILTGLPVLLDPFSLSLVPGSVTQLLPQWMVIMWGGQALAGGGLTITGITMGDFRIEQIGVLLLFGAAFIYSCALFTILPGSWVALVTYILFTLAMAARYWVLGKLIRLTGRLNKKVNADTAREEG